MWQNLLVLKNSIDVSSDTNMAFVESNDWQLINK